MFALWGDFTMKQNAFIMYIAVYKHLALSPIVERFQMGFARVLFV